MDFNELAHHIVALTDRIERDKAALSEARDQYKQSLVALEVHKQVKEKHEAENTSEE